MTEAPDFFADPPGQAGQPAPDGNEAARPDLLSGMLRNVRLRGEDIYCCTPVTPFAISFGHQGGTLHIINHGQFELQVDGQPHAYRYQRGDVILLPGRRPHVIRGDGRPVPARPLAPSDMRHDIVRGQTGTRWLSGTFSFDDSRGARLLHGLPPLIDLRGAGDQSLLWLDVSTEMLMKEKIFPSQGSAEMISRVLDLLFIQVLRAWAVRPDATAGWLTGAMDPVIGDAITSIHANPAHPWTIERLAGKSNLSRSAFADRFASRVGTPPAAYIAQVRLENAADLLHYTTQSISAIAHQIGYDSEAAFSRAFSKRYGMPPSRWRRRAVTPDTTTMRAE
jgi:AraC-like DNA-binding protein